MRLFVAILFGEDFKNALAAYQSDLMAWGKASWSRRENFHLTLAFIGERDSADDVIAALDRVEHKSFEAELAGGVRFGAIRCAGIADGGESRLLAGGNAPKAETRARAGDGARVLPHALRAQKRSACLHPPVDETPRVSFASDWIRSKHQVLCPRCGASSAFMSGKAAYIFLGVRLP